MNQAPMTQPGVPVDAFWLTGQTETGESFIQLAHQVPNRHPGFRSTISKSVLERFHLDRFCADFVLAKGDSAFTQIRPGDDPPDFVVEYAGSTARLDCTVLPLQTWRMSLRLFARLLERLAAESAQWNLTNLKGCAVDIDFDLTQGLPPKSSDDALVQPILELLTSARIDHEAAARAAADVIAHGFPDQAPVGVVDRRTTPDGKASITVNPVADPATPGIPEGPLQIQLLRSERFTITDLQTLLQKQVTQHDKGSSDLLLVSIGAPDREGIRYPGEEAVASFLIEQPGLTVDANNIRTVWLHTWSNAAVVEVPVQIPS